MKNYDKKTIIENIKKYRKTNNLTQEDLADKLSYSVKAIASWEQGLVVPPLDILIEFSSSLNISLEEFLGIKEESFFDYISQRTLHKFNYSLSERKVLTLGPTRKESFNKCCVDEGCLIDCLKRIPRDFYKIDENMIRRENGKLIFDLEKSSKTSNQSLNWKYLSTNIIFKMLEEEGLLTITETKIIFENKIANLVLKAILEPTKFPCWKEFSEYWEMSLQLKIFERQKGPSFPFATLEEKLKLEEEEKKLLDGFNNTCKENEEIIRKLLNNK